MNVPTITMDQATARGHLKEYRSALHKKADARYEHAANMYKELAKGRPLLRLADAFESTGFDDDGLPRLAICRADQRMVYYFGGAGDRRQLRFQCYSPVTHSGSVRWGPQAVRNVELPWERPTIERSNVWGAWYWRRAVVPMIPPRTVEEAGRFSAKSTFILWEVDHWMELEQPPKGSRDPFLLREIGGGLYVVLAHWDLTELEVGVSALFAE